MDPTDTIAAAGHRLQVRRTQPNRQQYFLDVLLRRQKVNADRLVLSMRYVCCCRKRPYWTRDWLRHAARQARVA